MTKSMTSETGYIDALKRLEARSWEQLYQQIYGELYNLLRKKLSYCYEDCIDDYIQEAFCRAYTGIQHFDGKSDIKTWVISIAHHVALDALRSIKRTRAILQEPANVKTVEGLCHGKQKHDPERTAHLHELRDKFARAIEETIPPKLSRVLLTSIQYELTEAEVAKTLNMKYGTASSYISQAKQRLRHCHDQLKALL